MKDIKLLLEKLNIKPNNLNLYIQALTHSSYANENDSKHYERLEFLGDAVLQIIISQYLFDNDLSDEGTLTKKRAQTVREETLNLYAQTIDLKDYILLGKGEEIKGANASIVADCFESLLAAIFLDQGIKAATKFVLDIYLPLVNQVSKIKDYKSTLQEYFAVDRKTLSYKTTFTGPSNKREFFAEVILDNGITLGRGKGLTKKDAEQQAAKEALSKMHRIG